MAAINEHTLITLKKHWLFSLCLSLTLSFFIYKGVTYAIIGSFIPLLVILSTLALFLYSFNKSHKAFAYSIGIWSILIILWSLIRLLLSMVNLFLKPIPEGHVDAQLGLFGITLSMVFLIAGFYMWRKRNTLLE